MNGAGLCLPCGKCRGFCQGGWFIPQRRYSLPYRPIVGGLTPGRTDAAGWFVGPSGGETKTSLLALFHVTVALGEGYVIGEVRRGRRVVSVIR